MKYQQDHLKYRRSLSNLDVVTRTNEKTRGDVTGFLGLSHVKGNFHAWFLEGKGLATTPTYSTETPFDELKPVKRVTTDDAEVALGSEVPKLDGSKLKRQT